MEMEFSTPGRVFFRRCAIAALAALGLLGAGLTRAASDDVEKPAARQVLDRALGFMARDAEAWRKKFGCATCHHGAMTVWALTEAKQQGYPVEMEALAELTRWTRDQFMPRVTEPRDHRPGWNFVSTPGIYFGVMSQNLPVLSREELAQLSVHLATRQEDDGAWTKPPPKNGAPPTWESRETFAMLGALAWDSNMPLDPKEAATVRAGREKLAAWLSHAQVPDTTQASALHLMLDLRSAAAAEQIKTDMAALLGRQNADGGWSQLKELPSDAYATGQALWALSFSGIGKERSEIVRAVSFLTGTQRPDGSWPMAHRDHEGVPVHAHNLVPITYFGSAWATIGLLRSVSVPQMLDLALRRERAEQAIKSWSGKCQVDEKRPGKPVVRVDLEFELTDQDMNTLISHLSAFPQLESLYLESSRLTDAGLAHIKELAQLRNLALEDAKITDSGLAQLTALTHLEKLNVKNTKISATGLEDFQKAMPKTRVER